MNPATKNESSEIYAAESSVASAANPNVMSLPVSISVCVGSARLTIDELLSLNADSILPLDAAIDDPVELFIGERKVARGALVETEGDPPGLGVRILTLISQQQDHS